MVIVVLKLSDGLVKSTTKKRFGGLLVLELCVIIEVTLYELLSHLKVKNKKHIFSLTYCGNGKRERRLKRLPTYVSFYIYT